MFLSSMRAVKGEECEPGVFRPPLSPALTRGGSGGRVLLSSPVRVGVTLPEGSKHLVPGAPEHALPQEILHHRPGGGRGRGSVRGRTASRGRGEMGCRARALRHRPKAAVAATSAATAAAVAAAAMRGCPAARHFRPQPDPLKPRPFRRSISGVPVT